MSMEYTKPLKAQDIQLGQIYRTIKFLDLLPVVFWDS